MSPHPENTGIDNARSKLGLDASVPARAYRVDRLDRPGEEYYLVIFGKFQASVGVAAVNSRTGEVMIFAKLPGTTEHLAIQSEQALECTGAPEGARTRLLWRPSRASHSPLYPVWEVSYGEKVTYVDHEGMTWDSLDEGPA